MNDIDLLNVALDYSSSAIIIGSSLRDGSNTIQDFRILFANRKAGDIMGRPSGDLAGDSFHNVFPADTLATVWEQAVEVVETGADREIESQLVMGSGESRWFTASLRRHEDGICITLHDTTTNKQTEQGLQKLIDELQRSNRNLEQFAYVASHDLQEPLRKLIGFGDILQSQYSSALGEPGIKLVQRMQAATQRMHILIGDLLGFSQVSSARDREPLKRIDLQEVVNNVISDLEPVIREKKAVLDITSLPYLEGDAGQIGQLFQNLLSNALKFTLPGDVPLIRIDCEVILGSAIQPMPGTAVLVTDYNRSFYAISVSDNGIGFDEKYLDRIFSIFQRLHNRTEYPGTGIGLAVVEKVIENHKGYLNAHSKPGQGAEFVIYLPDEPAWPEIVRGL